MKKAFLFLAVFIALSATAQKKPAVKGADSSIARIAAVNQPTINTPLLSFQDIQALRDSGMSNVPYKFAPLLDQINNWLTNRIQLRANEYIEAQRKKASDSTTVNKKP
jgi:hypothetical protein